MHPNFCGAPLPFFPVMSLSFLEAVAVAMTVAYACVGAIVALSRPRNAVGWLLLTIGGVTGLTLALDIAAQLHVPGGNALAWIQQWSFYLVYPAAFSVLLLLFPTGRLPTTKWTWLAVAIPAAQLPRLGVAALQGGPIAGHMSGTQLTMASPVGLIPDSFLASSAGQAFEAVSWLLPAVGIVAAGFSPSMRWRSEDEQVRRQVGWLALVAILAALSFLLHFAIDAWRASAFPDIGGIALAGLLSIGIPVAIGIALFRHGLYDVDRLLNRTIVYGALVAVLAGSYVGVVALLDIFLQRRLEAVSAVVATALVAVSFAPVRERIQSAVDRLLFGARPDSYEVLAQVAVEVARGESERPLLSAVAASIARTLAIPYVSIKTTGAADGAAVNQSIGTRPANLVTIPLHYSGREVGAMALGPLDALRLRRLQRRLLTDIASQAAVAAHTVNLAAELQASRSKIVAAREEERRRLRRDLHDSLGPAMAALTLKAGAARMAIESNPLRAEALMQEVERGSQATTGEIRRIAHSLRPPALDELGLLGAIRQVAETSVDASVKTVVQLPDELPSLPAEIEASVLRIAQEALSNVHKHSGARTCWVELSVGSDLQLAVRDDGIGLRGRRRPGVGLASMSERAAELGGTTDVRTGNDGGTEVRVRIPLAGGERG